MLHGVNRGLGLKDVLKESTSKDAIYALVNVWKDVTRPTLQNVLHKRWFTYLLGLLGVV